MSLSKDPLLSKPYPAKAHARRVSDGIAALGYSRRGLIYLESQKSHYLEDSDMEAVFRQRRHFYYLSGCTLPNCHVTYDMERDYLTLYLPPIDEDDVMWSGLPISIDEAKAKYDVDDVRYSEPDLTEDVLSFPSSEERPIYAIEGRMDRFLPFNQILNVLKDVIDDQRAKKDEYEVALIRHANKISKVAHEAVMKQIKNIKNEQEAAAIFLHGCLSLGAPVQAYSGIFASGRNAATLHYVKNNEDVSGRLNILVDAGAEYEIYASDITRTYPLNGTFTTESRHIYDIVLRMQKVCLDAVKPGASWESIHELAHKTAIQGLLDIGILHNGSVDEIWENRTSVAFFPHGLGHMLGMDTHDTGGNPNYKDSDKAFRYLRIRRKLEVGHVVTVEPGVYFCEFIVRPYLEDVKHKKYINKEVLDRYWDVGGVRIEGELFVGLMAVGVG